jgi:multiple sugar transport system permease protein
MAAFGFSRYNFKAKKTLFFIVLSTLMVPGQITLIPVFITINSFGWINSFKALIIPGIANGFGIFLINQFAVDLPGDFFDSARIDGAPERLLYTRIFIPLCKPIIATLSVLEFVGRWNDLFWPLIVANKPEMMPLTLYLTTANRGVYDIYWNDLAASMVIAVVPILIIYVFLQKYFIQGISLTSGIKG